MTSRAASGRFRRIMTAKTGASANLRMVRKFGRFRNLSRSGALIILSRSPFIPRSGRRSPRQGLQGVDRLPGLGSRHRLVGTEGAVREKLHDLIGQDIADRAKIGVLG